MLDDSGGPGPSSGPSWIVPRADSSSKQFNPEAPFGYVDPEFKLKAYFKTVEDQLREWQQNRITGAPGVHGRPHRLVGLPVLGSAFFF